jgi:hypothetical protein
MARKKFFYPPVPPVGSQTFSDNLVGLQLVQGGGLTLGTFEFTSAIFEKSNRNFDTGIFSQPYNLTNLDISSVEESKLLVQKNFQVYPNFDISQITSFSLYGSLQKRLEVSITKSINYFPAAIIAKKNIGTGYSAITANNIIYDQIGDETTFEIDVKYLTNPFDIDYSVNATSNLVQSPMSISEFRNLTKEFKKYAIYIGSTDNEEYNLTDFTASPSLTGGTITITVQGKPFSGLTSFTETIIIKPNNLITEKIFSDSFDEVEDFLLNRNVSPKYTATFTYPEYDDDGTYILNSKSVTWPLSDEWNIDIRSLGFENYINEVKTIAELLDSYKTNLISRFLITGSLKDFDTPDQKLEKVLQIYGRSFDETKKFIDALANINSVNYIVGNDIPSQLLVNLAQTVGFDPNVSPITNEDFLNSIFTTSNESDYGGMSKPMTPTELNYQFYRNLILNSAYLFKSKGTRKSIEFVMRMVGAPDALIEFNENVYLADGPINFNDFRDQYVCLSGSTLLLDTPAFDTTNTFTIQGILYTGFTTVNTLQTVTATFEDFPIYEDGYPKAVEDSPDYFFQKGAGWFEQTPEHTSLEVVDEENSIFSGNSVSLVTKFKPFTYGQDWLDRFRKFPFMTNVGYNLLRTVDNTKSWPKTEVGIRRNQSPNSSTYYRVDDDRLVINVKNIDLYLNMGQGITYDVWEQSVLYNYPIPNSGLTAPYPTPGDTDWTVINPKPDQKTFFEFAQTFYNNLINVRNRWYINDGKTGGYPALQSIFWKYLQSDEAINIPTNKFTYQKMIDFTLALGDYWVRLVEQFVPATTIWNTGQKMDNSAFHRQKFVWRRQRGCEFIPVNCIPCVFNGQPFGYDCIDQTITCDVNLNQYSGAEYITTAINQSIDESGYEQFMCDLQGMKSYWYVDVRLDDNVLIQEQFYTGYGSVDYPTQSTIINAINEKLENLYLYGLNYYFSGNNLIVSNSTCYDDFTNKRLYLNIGVMIDMVCNSDG